MSAKLKGRTLLASTALIIVLSGVGIALYSGHRADASVPAAVEQAVPVGVAVIKKQPVKLWSEFSGRLRAVDFAEIRPEVSGRIVDIRFQDGQAVNAGDILFVIDPSSYQAAVAKAEANLASATTNAAFAKTELSRAEGLLNNQAVAKSLYDQRENQNKVAQAAVQVASAELKQARLDLDHAYVKAPITGHVSRAEITLGNLVQTGPAAPVLTSIASNNGIYADFEIDEQTYLRDIRAEGRIQDIPVQLSVQGDESHVYTGHIESFDNRIDTASGTIRARAMFGNEDSSLMPGMTVTLRVADKSDENALLVPQGAVGTDQNKKFVYVVGADNKVAYREVEVGRQVNDSQIVLSGIKPGDRVVVEGIQHVHPDSLVAAKEIASAQ
jgi:multidrug efflux system membrane fusion protein